MLTIDHFELENVGKPGRPNDVGDQQTNKQMIGYAKFAILYFHLIWQLFFMWLLYL